MSKDFYTIRLNTIRGNEEIPFDLYVAVGQRLVHYTRANDAVEAERLRGLKNHGVKKLFIRPEDEASYLGYLEVGIQSLSNKSVSIDDRAARANDTLIVSAENAERNLDTEVGYLNQRRQLEHISVFIGEDRKAIKSMLSASGLSMDTNQHSATVCSLSLAVATKLGGFEKEDLTELAYAALLHDIGKSRLKFDYSKPYEELTKEQQRQYQQHPADGVSMLAGKPFISPRILGLIASHEEYGEGRGYPEKKNLFQLDPSYQVLSLTNKFDRFCTVKNLAPFQAMDPFFEQHSTFYDENLLATLATVLT
jgi:HD-GYP domain-containing protein (c-di-GMP phosphodiesterase class II)